jgi:hypothetical protein
MDANHTTEYFGPGTAYSVLGKRLRPLSCVASVADAEDTWHGTPATGVRGFRQVREYVFYQQPGGRL